MTKRKRIADDLWLYLLLTAPFSNTHTQKKKYTSLECFFANIFRRVSSAAAYRMFIELRIRAFRMCIRVAATSDKNRLKTSPGTPTQEADHQTVSNIIFIDYDL